MIKKKKVPKPRNPLGLHGYRRKTWTEPSLKIKRQKDKERKELRDATDE